MSTSVNNMPADVGGDAILSPTIADHDDWHSLVFDGSGTIGAAGDPQAAPDVTNYAESTATQLHAVETDIKAVTLTSPGQLAVHSNTAAPVSVTVQNQRTTPVTYSLTQLAGGVTLTGLPAQVVLAAGETRTLTGVLTATAATDTAYFEVDAAATPPDPSNNGSTVTTVYVTDETVTGQPPVTGALDHLTVAVSAGPVVVGTPVTFSVSGADAQGNPAPAPGDVTLAITPDGTCTGSGPTATCIAVAAGTHTVTATSGTAHGQVTFPVTASAASATVAATGGDGQSAPIRATFGRPLQVLVTDASGHPAARIPVTFTIASSATFTGGGTTATVSTDRTGHAVSPELRAGAAAGPFTVSAALADGTATTFTETITDAGRSEADLQVSVTAPGKVAPGQTGEHRLVGRADLLGAAAATSWPV